MRRRERETREQESKRAREQETWERRKKEESKEASVLYMYVHILYGYIVWSQEKPEGGKPVRQRKIYGTCGRYTATLQ